MGSHVGRRQRRVGGECDDERGGERDADGDRQDRHEVADDAGPEEERHEGADRRQGRVEHRAADLAGADLRRLEGGLALLHVAVDVVDDDDRVVDQHADREHQREQHHHVERHARQLHDYEGEEHREWDRRADEERVAQPHGEEEHDDDEDHAGEDVVLEIGDHDPDVLRLVCQEGRLDPRRPGAAQAVDGGLQPVGELDDVRARTLLHRQRHRFAAVDARVGAALLEAVAHRGDVAHLHRALVDHLDHELLDGDRIVDLARDAQGERLPLERELAARNRDVLVADRVEHVVERGAIEPQPLRVDVDLHLALDATDERRAQHAGDRLDLVLNRLRQPPQLDRTDVAGEMDLEDRHVGEVELAQDRLLGVGRELGLGEVDPVAHLLQREVEIDAGDELDVHHRNALGRRRSDLLDPLEALELALELVGELALDVGGGGSRPEGVDEDVGDLDVREALARQRVVGRAAGDDDREQGEEDRGAVPDRELAEPHARPPRPAGSRPPPAALDDDVRPGRKAFDHDLFADHHPGSHLAPHRAPVGDRPDGLGAAEVDQRGHRDDEGPVDRLTRDVEAGEHAGLQPAIGVGELGLDREGARLRVELGAEALDLCRELLAREGIEADLDLSAHGEETHVCGARFGADLDPRGVDELEERRAGGDEAADLDVARRDSPRPRRSDARLVERELRRREPSHSDVPVGDRVEQLRLGHRLAFEEVLGALELKVRLPQPGFGFGHLLRQGAFVDRRQQLPSADGLPELGPDGLDGAADFGGQHGALPRLQGGRQARAVDDSSRR